MSFSIRNLLGRHGAEVPGSGGDHGLAQKLVDRGIASEQSGNTAKALQDFRKAVEADDSFAPAHLNLGIALQAAGESAAAIASYERAITVDPEYAAAHYNLALVHLLRSQYAEAETRFRTALRLRDDFPEAWVGLAGALEALERQEEALSALEKAIALRGAYVGALDNAIALLRKMGRFDEAVRMGRRVLDVTPDNPVAWCRLGDCLHELGHFAEAESSYRSALAANPDYLEAKVHLAWVLTSLGSLEAIPLLFELVAQQPANAQLRRNLAEALRDVALTRAEEKEREILVSLCLDDTVSTLFLTGAIVALVKGEEGFEIAQEIAMRGEDPFTSVHPTVTAFMRDPLLLAALPRMSFPDAAVEEVFTHMRRWILLRSEVPGLAEADPAVPAEFTCAMARHCFFSGYAFFAREDELSRVAGVRKALQATLREPIVNPRALEPALAVVSLYDSLHTLQGCERLLAHPASDWSEAFRPLLIEQIENRKHERELAKQLASITAIDDEVSVAVRAQYEENPYPRWVTAPSANPDTLEKFAKRLRPDQVTRDRQGPAPILIAGCGTGRHPILVARAYPDSDILAVDLSLASLGYAARMTQRLGISNIAYRQGDILKLGDLDRRFAMIECGGVLHHLRDPMAGWRALVNLLEPDGFMRIALYSEKARSSVRAAREFAGALNIPLTPEGIRHCRQIIMKLPAGHPARDIMAGSSDFFTIDGCRDLMFHVQEHQFTLPRIADCLDQLGLRLLRLECEPRTRNSFVEMFPDRSVDTDLDAWDQFEEAFPRTFSGMYSFWCCKK